MPKFTADEWDHATHPWRMFAYLKKRLGYGETKDEQRKLRLFGCASARRSWPRFAVPDEAVFFENLERVVADGGNHSTVSARWEVARYHRGTGWMMPPACKLYELVSHKRAWVSAETWSWVSNPGWIITFPHHMRDRMQADWDAETAAHADLARCVFGNPLRPITFAPAWRTSAAVGLAAAVHETRDFARLPILADALEEAGCGDPHVLAHCRTHPHHALGCWVIDGVLGK